MHAYSRATSLASNPVVLIGALVSASLAYVVYTPGSPLQDAPEVTVPLGISVALLLLTEELRSRDYESAQIERMVRCGWAGALVAGLVSAWWILLHLSQGIVVTELGDQILSAWSVSIGAGAIIGGYTAGRSGFERRPERERVLAETTWVNREATDPILTAVVEQLAELEGVSPLELEPLNDHVDPDLLTELRTRDDSEWQFAFYTDAYEVRINSHGTVTVYESRRRIEPRGH